MGGDDGGFALAHDLDDLAQDTVDLSGEGDLLAVGAEEQAGFAVALDEAGQVEELVEILGREDHVVVSAMVDGGDPGSA